MSTNLCKQKNPEETSGLLQWYLQESNQGHKDFQSFALPTELRYQPLVDANLTHFCCFTQAQNQKSSKKVLIFEHEC